jgi:hypothetical protein
MRHGGAGLICIFAYAGFPVKLSPGTIPVDHRNCLYRSDRHAEWKHVFRLLPWKTITWHSFQFDVTMIPAIGTGAFLGIWLVDLFPERA